MAPRIAVIIPTYNDGHLAKEAVASLRGSEEIELVVIDDGSTDPDALRALDELRADHVNVVRQENQGLGPTRMNGLRLTSAPYIFPLDADDLAIPSSLSRMASVLDQNPQASFVWGDFEVFGSYDGFYRAPDRFDPYLLTWCNPYPVCSMYRRDALVAVRGWEVILQGQGYEDWDVWLKFAESGHTGLYLGAPAYRRRLLPGRMLSSARRGPVHRALLREIRSRHSDLYARRRQLARESGYGPLQCFLLATAFMARSYTPVWLESVAQRTMHRYMQIRRKS